MPHDSQLPSLPEIAATGVAGLDDVLEGGLTRNRLYVIEGVPGSGKTTLALQFAIEGARAGEKVLYVSLSETIEEMEDVARSHGWSLAGVSIHELVPDERNLQPAEHYTVFHPAEVELGETIDAILREVDKVKPKRVVIDSLSELRLLAANPLKYRRQILALKQFFVGRRCTVLLLDDLSAERDLQVQSIANGVMLLEQLNPEYGAERRRLRILKHRGRRYRGGYHDYAIRHGGLQVFPRLVASEHRDIPSVERLPSGLPELDVLLGGGIGRGTSTLLLGAAGTGKSSIAVRFAVSAAERGEHSALFVFDESRTTLLNRSRALGMGIEDHEKAGLISLQQVDPAELSPGELTQRIRDAVEQRGARIVVIDSLNGYLNAMPEERFLITQLHELLMYLGQRGVSTMLVGAQYGLIGSSMVTPVDASYLADTVVVLRYYEARGEVRQAISVLKKRDGLHERSIRGFTMSGGLAVGEPLREFRGILTGVPVNEKLLPPGEGS